MRRVRLLSLLLMLPGCMSQPRALPLIGAPSPDAGHRLVVELTLPRQVQATVSRNLVALIDHYTATLLRWDGSSFVPLPIPLSGSTTELTLPKFAFHHLGPGRYQVRAIGYNASNTPLTSESSADIDLTGNDVDMAAQVTVALTMLPAVFSATLPLPSNATVPGSVPAWVTGLEAVVSVGGTEIARHSYTPGQAPALKNLAAGVSYDLTVTASKGMTYSDDDSYTYFADPNGATLDDAPTHAFSWTAPAPVLTTFSAGTTPFAVAADASGNVWVPNFDSANVTRISATGSLSTVTAGTSPRYVVADASGNAWVTNTGTNNVTRISATGSLSTFAVGSSPTAMTLDGSGNAWVANQFSNNVTRISTTGSLSTYTVGAVPRAVAVDAAGNAWVVNTSSTNVTRISATGSLSTFSVGAAPVNVAVDAAGNAWVTNSGSDNVTRISSTGSLSTYTAGTSPWAIAADANGEVWVTNRNSNNVTRISATGSLSTLSTGTAPYAVTVDGSGTVWVANNNSANVTRIQP